jgi:hypothetical protein
MDSAQMELAPVAPVFDSLIHEQLLERRGRLKEVAAIAGTEFELPGCSMRSMRRFASLKMGDSANAKTVTTRSSLSGCSPIL